MVVLPPPATAERWSSPVLRKGRPHLYTCAYRRRSFFSYGDPQIQIVPDHAAGPWRAAGVPRHARASCSLTSRVEPASEGISTHRTQTVTVPPDRAASHPKANAPYPISQTRGHLRHEGASPIRDRPSRGAICPSHAGNLTVDAEELHGSPGLRRRNGCALGR